MRAADKHEFYVAKMAEIIYRSVSIRALTAPSLKMRVFWLIGDIFSWENVSSLKNLMSKLNVKNLIKEFLHNKSAPVSLFAD